jgi:ribosome biogenesis GTP-binding protein YsxC/EngB
MQSMMMFRRSHFGFSLNRQHVMNLDVVRVHSYATLKRSSNAIPVARRATPTPTATKTEIDDDEEEEPTPMKKVEKKYQELERRKEWQERSHKAQQLVNKKKKLTTTKATTKTPARTTTNRVNNSSSISNNAATSEVTASDNFVRSDTHWKKLPIMPHIRNYIERVQGGKYYTPRNVRIDKHRTKTTVSSPRKRQVEISRSTSSLLAVYDYVFDTKKVKFVAGAENHSSIPHPYVIATGKTLDNKDTAMLRTMKYLPEVAFAGRSNVGKSSLLNSLINSGGKARVGDKPGLTQSINFYKVADYFCFVDLPGYGFAFANDEKSQQWNELVKWFLHDRHNNAKTLKRVFVLIDARHGLKSSDYDFLQYLSINKVQNQIIFTKNDLVSGDELAKKLYAMELAMKEDEVTFRHTIPHILLVSSKSKSGVHDLQRIISSFIDPHKLSIVKQKLETNKAKNQVLF